MDKSEVDTVLVPILDEILAQDQEVKSAAADAQLDVDDLRNGVLRRVGDVEASTVPEFNRMVDLRRRVRDIEDMVTRRRWDPPPMVKVPRYLAIGIGALVVLAYTFSSVAYLAGWQTPLQWLWGAWNLPGPIAMVILVAIPAFVAACAWGWNALWISRAAKSPALELLRSQRDAEETNWKQALREKGVKALLRELINDELPSYSNTFDRHEAAGLSELRDPLYEIRTRSRADIEALLSTMPGGSIGVSGPRGVGKTTLLRRFCSPDYQLGTSDPGKGSLRIMLSAPVRYDAREFILHLFSTVCETLVGSQRQRPRFGPRPQQPDVVRDVLLRWGILMMLFSIAWGVVLALTVIFNWKLNASLQAAALWLFGGSTGFVAWRTTIRARWDVSPWDLSSSSERLRDQGDQGLIDSANRLLVGLAYQQTFSQGWSAAVKLPVGVDTGVTANTTMTEKPMTFPELVKRLNSFLTIVSQSRRVHIGIDELDKIEADRDAYQFLNDIKGIFGHEDCYYFVSISQNAMSAFERRGLPLRDAFDSAFDAVVDVDYLDLPESERLLRRRVIGMPVGFLCLCYAISGGLPRDLIRAARDVVRLARAREGPIDLGALAGALVKEDILRKIAAARIAAQGISLEPQVGLFVQMLDGCSDRLQLEDVDIRAAVEENLRTAVTETGTWTSEADAEAVQALRSLWLEMSSYLYFGSAVLTFFDTDLALDDLARAEKSCGAEGIRQLGRARQSFAVSARGVWTLITAFKVAWGWEGLEFPGWLYGESGSAMRNNWGTTISLLRRKWYTS